VRVSRPREGLKAAARKREKMWADARRQQPLGEKTIVRRPTRSTWPPPRWSTPAPCWSPCRSRKTGVASSAFCSRAIVMKVVYITCLLPRPDRSYRRPLDEFNHDPRLIITLPSFVVLLIAAVILVSSLRFCHYLAYQKCAPNFRSLTEDAN